MAVTLRKTSSLEEVRRKIRKAEKAVKKPDFTNLVGKLTLTVDPISYQKEIRNEWE